MNTTFEQRIDMFRKKLFESDLSSEIQKRMDHDYDFLLIYDDNDELIDLMNETIHEFSELKRIGMNTLKL